MSTDETLTDNAAAEALAALGNATRLGVYRLLVRAGPEGLNVGTIRERMDMPASTLTHHLTALRAAGLITQTRDGREILCAVDFTAINAVVDYLTGQCCADVTSC